MTEQIAAASVLPAMDSHHSPAPNERPGVSERPGPERRPSSNESPRSSESPGSSARGEQVRGEMAGMDQGMRVLSYLIGGVLVYGALGWLGDHYLGTAFLLPVGIVLGAAGGCYVIIRRYGRVPGVGADPQKKEGPR